MGLSQAIGTGVVPNIVSGFMHAGFAADQGLRVESRAGARLSGARLSGKALRSASAVYGRADRPALPVASGIDAGFARLLLCLHVLLDRLWRAPKLG